LGILEATPALIYVYTDSACNMRTDMEYGVVFSNYNRTVLQ